MHLPDGFLMLLLANAAAAGPAGAANVARQSTSTSCSTQMAYTKPGHDLFKPQTT